MRCEPKSRSVTWGRMTLSRGLSNRTLLRSRITEALAQLRHDEMFCLLYLDLDQFKNVNDTYGHSTGDLILKEAAQRFQLCLGKGDVLARLGATKFVILQMKVERPQQAGDLAIVLSTSCRPLPRRRAGGLSRRQHRHLCLPPRRNGPRSFAAQCRYGDCTRSKSEGAIRIVSSSPLWMPTSRNGVSSNSICAARSRTRSSSSTTSRKSMP